MKVCSVCQRCYEDEVVSCVEENHKSFDFERPGGREIINGFRLDSLLKSDATGKTYRAANIALDQSCLVKIMTAPDDQGSKERFLEQAQLLAAVNHPNLVPVYQSGVLPSGELFVITEETSGQTLRDCLNHGSLVSEVTAVQIARQAAEGLEAIHAAGMTHLNINPDNIILTSDLEHRLLVKLQNPDFGGFNQKLIISPTSNPELRLNGLRYFSPEQCDGQAKNT
jgi:serine/threonine protein kinase